MNWRAIGQAITLFLAIAVVASAQQLNFQLFLTVGNSTFTTQNGARVFLSSAVGQAQTARVKAIYTGSGQVTISQQPIAFGSSDFSAEMAPPPPLTLKRGDNFTFDIRFLPTSTNQRNAQLSLGFEETPPVIFGATAIELALQGTASSIIPSYVLPAAGNTVPLQPGGLIVFPATAVKTSSQAAFSLTNKGSAAGIVSSLSISGAAFRLSGLPLFPVTLEPGESLQVQVLYEPTVATSDSGQITTVFDTGQVLTINLRGSGTAASLIYQILQANPVLVPPDGSISLPNTNVGETSSVVIRILNSGSADGVVHTIALAGQAFQLSRVPTLPQTLLPDGSLTFTVTFSPNRPGAQNGALILNSDTLNLSGMGLGPQLTLSYIAGGTSTVINADTPSVVFSPVTISGSVQIEFHVRNSGTAPTPLANIGVSQVSGPFSVSGLPSLPLTLAPNADLSFTINFAPTSLGFSNGTLQVDRTTVPLVGSGTAPPPLPSYTIVGPSGNIAAASQTSVGLTLASSYPVAIAGVLTLSSSGDLSADPAVQFATGGRTVPFVIPANTTNAVFGSQRATSIGLQAGTVASTISLTPSFATQEGGVDLNPRTPVILQFNVAPAAPVLTGVQLSSPATNALVIKVTGFSTTRALSSFNVQFTTVAGFSMPTSQFTIDVQQAAASWFQSGSSQQFGGQYVMTVQFNFQGGADGQSALDSIASVALTASNPSGNSNIVQAKLR